MTALIIFTRELSRELRSAADQWDADLAVTPGLDAGHILRLVAGAIDAAAKKAFHL